jgi:hypothetical protein
VVVPVPVVLVVALGGAVTVPVPVVDVVVGGAATVPVPVADVVVGGAATVPVPVVDVVVGGAVAIAAAHGGGAHCTARPGGAGAVVVPVPVVFVPVSAVAVGGAVAVPVVSVPVVSVSVVDVPGWPGGPGTTAKPQPPAALTSLKHGGAPRRAAPSFQIRT